MTETEIIQTVSLAFQDISKDYENTETAEAFSLALILVLILGANANKNVFVNSNLKSLIIKKSPNLEKLFKGNTFTTPPKVREYITNIFSNEYKGVKFTTNNRLNELKKNLVSIKDLQMFRKERKADLEDTIQNIMKQNGLAILADENGLRFVKAITRRDVMVRDSHRKNDGKTWLAKTYKPWQDYNCRCFYTFFN